MVVDINTNKLIKLGITAEEYFLLQMIKKKAFTSLKKYYSKVELPDQKSLDKLVKLRLIHNPSKFPNLDFSKIVIRNKFLEELSTDVDLFNAFYNLYPISVERPDGFKDYLRTDKIRCRRSYLTKISGSETIHNEIMECLKLEIETRTKEGSLAYMKRMPKWLASEEWQIWKERKEAMKNRKLDSTIGYGLKLE